MSEPEKCLSVGKNFSRREWLMLIVILLLIEAGALISSHSFMSNQDVINYISFASTIASLLLAVLAIVYGFYQSESQKRTGDGIDNHLSNLRGTTDEMRKVSGDLVNSARGISGLSQELRLLDDAIKSTHEKLSNMELDLKGVSQNQMSLSDTLLSMQSNNSGERVSKALELDKIRWFLTDKFIFSNSVVAYSLYKVFKGKENVDINIGFFLSPISKILGDIKFLSYDEKEWRAIALLSIMQMARFGVVVGRGPEDFTYDRISVEAGAFGVLKEAVDIYLEIPRMMDAIAVLDQHLLEIRSGLKESSP
ncbi:hypothetical protein [Delftia acidovorans]|uniref:hypothetical protein n=1 Tax=Delftia acidovorans TaxID=80866 RepID=UPI0012FD8BD5|nr:hypothetical protein [Delftia acidovorans]